MAKQFSTFQFTGKVGTLVGMKGKNGSAYIRTLVTPTNPKTTAQTDQRVKMSLAGQMSKLTPQALLVGMSNDKRMRRPNFTGNIARNAVVTTVDNQRTAKIDPAQVLFSDGAAAMVDANQISVTAHVADIGIIAQPNAFANDVVTLIMVLAFADTDGRVTNIIAEPMTVDTPETNVVAPNRYARVNVYYIPVVRTDRADSVSYERLVSMVSQDGSYQAVARLAESGSVEYRRSQFINTYTAGN